MQQLLAETNIYNHVQRAKYGECVLMKACSFVWWREAINIRMCSNITPADLDPSFVSIACKEYDTIPLPLTYIFDVTPELS